VHARGDSFPEVLQNTRFVPDTREHASAPQTWKDRYSQCRRRADVGSHVMKNMTASGLP